MKTLCALAGTAVAAVALLAASPQETSMKTLTPVLMVEEIEPVLPFWEALGFEKTMEVPEGDGMGFVGLQSGDVQIMYQTVESVRNDIAELAEVPMKGTFLFIEVEDLDAVAENLGDTEYVVPRRTTFYGADEIVVREPGGNYVIFAEFGEGGEG